MRLCSLWALCEIVSARSASSAFVVFLVVALVAINADVIAQDAPEPPTLPAVREGLLPVPLPSLESIEAPVAQQIEEALQSVRDSASKPESDRSVLAGAYGRLGQVLHAYEFFEAADACYRNAMRLAPREYRWPHLLGSLRQQTGAFEQAIDLYRGALRLEPEDHVAAVRLGDAYLQLDRRGEARVQFEAARVRFPASSTAGLGEIALRERRFPDAIRLFEDVLRRAPHATRLHYSLGMAYRGLGRMEEAEAHLTQAGQGRVRAADPLVDALPSLLQGTRALLNQGRIELQAGAYDAAAAAFRRAIAAGPDSPEARTGLAAALERLGDQDGAFAELTEAARRSPSSAEAQRQLARALLVRGRADDAVGVLQTAVSLDAGDEDSLLQLAILLADRRRLAEALDLLDRAYQRFPDRARTATTLARMLAASPDVSQRDGPRALQLATRVYERQPTPTHGETVALSLAELGRCAEAAEWLRRAVAEAERVEDATEVARLKGESPKYGTASCRP